MKKIIKNIIISLEIASLLLPSGVSLFIVPPPKAEASVHTITSRADFSTGLFTNTEATTQEGEIKLKGNGTWNARVWRTPYLTQNDGTLFATDGTYSYMLVARDIRFSRYLPDEDRWQTLASAPHMPYTGGDMIYLNGYIYVAYGGYQKEFSRYSIATNTWTDLTNLPELTFAGSTLQTDGTYVYAMRGASTSDFWRYNPSTNSWSTLTSTPATMSYGADLIFDNSSGSGYLYTPRGANTTTFYRYDITNATWSTMAAAPGTLNDNGNTTKRGDYIYVLRGSNTNTFYRYSISGNSWTTITNTPAATRYVGVTYNSYEDQIYVFRGNGTYDWWKYDPDAAVFAGPTDLPATPGTGADLVYYNGYVYYRRGNNSTSFYRYNISTDTWSTLAVAPAAFNDDTKVVLAGSYLYFIRGSGTTGFYRYDPANDSWSTMAVTPATASYGSSLAYPGSGDYIYATRGGLSSGFWRYSISGDSWDDASVADVPVDSEAGYGSRIISNGTDIFMITGSGISNILQYTIGTNSWSVLNTLPFSPYYGTDIVYYNGKIYALGGYYKTSFWEYTINTNSWRALPDMAGYYANDIGPYNGGSIAADTSNGVFYVISGMNLVRMLTYTPGVSNYPDSGTWISNTLDLTFVNSFTSLTSNVTTPSDTAVTFETRSSADRAIWTSWQTVTGGIIASTAQRYLEIRATLSASSDNTSTPVLTDLSVNYSGDSTAPSNPNGVTGSSQAVGGSAITSGLSYKYNNPYFSWSGASDTESSISGYYVYFGTNSSADPVTDGNFQTATNYTVTRPMSTGSYYLLIKTKDSAGNISNSLSAFTYVYSGVGPSVNVSATTTADFSSGTADNVSTANDQIKLSSKPGFWLQERLSLSPASMYYGASFAYVSSSNKLYTFRGNNTTTFYEYNIATDVWTAKTAAPAAVYQGGDLVEGPSGYLYGFPGRNLNTFWQYNISTDTWSDAAAADAPYSLYYGSSAVYDGSNYIYVLRGNSDDAFMRYDTQSNTWDTLANTEFDSPASQISNAVYIGGDLAYDGNGTVYAIQGNTYTGFSSYSVASNTWTSLPNTPAIPYDGSQIVYDSASNAIYFISGWNNPFFYKYDINTQTWIKLTDSPAPFAGGAAMRNVNGTLYMLRGANTTTFWKYNIAKASWLTPTVGLFGTEFRGTDYRTFNYGANIVKGDGSYFYLTRGNYDNLFVRYDGSTGEAVQMADAPAGFYLGSTLAYNSTTNKIYATPSQYVRKLLVYDIATDVWSEEALDPPLLDVGAGSAMRYDGSRYLYLIRANGTTTFYRYDTQAAAGSRWSTMSALPGAASYGSSMVIRSNYIYVLRGNNQLSFYRYDINANTWSDPAVADLPSGATIYNDGFLVDEGGDTLFACRGANTAACYEYSITNNTWTATATSPANISQGGSAASNGTDRIFVIAGTGTNNTFQNGLYSYVFQTSSSAFEESGTFSTPSYDLTSVYRFANLSLNYTSATNSNLVVETRSSSDNSTWSVWTESSEEKATGSNYSYKINSPANRYLQARFTLTSTDGIYSGAISDYEIHYYQDATVPVNPTSLSSYSTSTQSAAINTNTWYNYTSPNFDWPDAESVGGATDTSTGSGVTGYYVYFGTNSSADPQTDGSLQSGSSYTASSLVSGNTYYLRIKTKDDAGNISTASWQPFIYKFDNTAPTNPTTVVADPPGYTNVNSFDFAWSGATDSASMVAEYCYKTGAAGAVDTCITAASVSAITSYQSGANTFYVRAKDLAGNLSDTYVNASYYYSSTAPGAVQNLEASPTSNAINEFAFSWDPPALYSGAQAGLRYYYSVNAHPNAQNVNAVGLTTTYVTADAYATVPGENIFYVVAKDEAGNIDYDNYASVTFTANTSAPGAIRNVDIADVSVKSTSNWRLAVSWDEPISSGSGVANYKVYRSTVAGSSCAVNFGNFTYVASTIQESYVDTGLTQQKYYYCAKACDSTNNCSAVSDTVSFYPDGKWTVAPAMSASPSATIKTKSAVISWSTDRTANSFVKYGTKSGDYGDEVGSSEQVAYHEITLDNLTPGTKYYYKVLWTDEDGNTGTSDELTLETNPAPFISAVKVKNTSITSTYLSFVVKNSSKVTVQYGKTSNYGGIKTISTAKSETEHTVLLDDLLEGTLYHYRIVAEDEEENSFAGDDYTFETLPVPKITAFKIQQVAGLPTATLRLIWSTNTEVSTIITYYPEINPSAVKDFISLKLSRTHDVLLKDLQDNTEYVLTIRGKDSAGNEAIYPVQRVKTAVDFRPPEILNMEVEATIQGVGEEAKAQVIVTWDTDEPATTQVEYAEGTGSSYGQSTQEDPALTTNHSVTITGLSPAKIYHLRAISKDKINNNGKSSDYVVVTPKSTKDALDLVIDNLSKTFKFLKRK